MNKKYLVSGLLIVVCVLIIGYMQIPPKSVSGEPIKIGALFPLTGGLAHYGEPAEKSARLAMEEINANGGVDGRPLEIDFQDHQCKPPVAVSIFQQMSAVKNIDIFTSVACTGTVVSIAPLLQDDQVLLLNTVTGTAVSGISPLVFRNYASDADVARLFADYVVEKNVKKVAVIYEETEYAKGLKIMLEANLAGKDIELIGEGYSPETTDMRTQISKLKAAQPDLLFISPQTITSADKVLRQMEELSFRPQILLVNENIYRSTELTAKYSTTLEGAISVDYILEKTSKAQRVLGSYEKKYGEECPQTNICLGVYDNIYILAEAIEKEGADNPTKIREYLSKISYSGVSGKIKFDKNNDRENAHFTLFRVVGGEGVEVK